MPDDEYENSRADYAARKTFDGLFGAYFFAERMRAHSASGKVRERIVRPSAYKHQPYKSLAQREIAEYGFYNILRLVKSKQD